jgi:septal ring factor EnvC (AmiA/AmiB activator)
MSEGEKIRGMMTEIEELDKKIEEVSKKKALLQQKLNKAREAFDKKNLQLKELQIKKDAATAGILMKAAREKDMSLDDVLGLIKKEEAV